MVKEMVIGNRTVGGDAAVYIIAEAGINHNGDLDLAKEMITLAKKCGVDAIKFQIFKSEEFVSSPNDVYTYTSQGRSVTESMLSMFARLEFNEDEWKEIFKFCKKKHMDFFATPQNSTDLDFLLSLADVPAIKVGSDDLTNLELLKYYASKGKPMIISAGMAYLSEIEEAANAIRETGNTSLAILHCSSIYPCDAADVHLRKMLTIRHAFDVVTGFSDHTKGSVAAIGAVALGASIIEKHFTLDKNLPGPDHWFSADPDELEDYVKSIRFIEQAMGNITIEPSRKELEMRKLARRSVVAAADILEGQIIERDLISLKRPGTGLPPKYLKYILGKKARSDIKKNDRITFDDIW